MFRKTISHWLLSTAAALSLTACGGKGDSESDGPAKEATEVVSKKIEAFTGDHSKMVWTKYVGGGSSDAYLTYSKHQLWGIDTRDGKGIRVIQETPNNYGRPMVSPDGESIVWTNKGGFLTGKKDKDGKTIKAFKPVIYQTDWSGENVKELGKGYAVDVWRDPGTGITWVYVANLLETTRASLYADKLERFQLDDPGSRELIWDKTQLSTENIQLSKDGKRASALFPWPDAGVLDLEAGENRVNNFGCWPSLAPDNSYYAWVFAGDHKHIHLFDDVGEKRGKIEVGTAPGIGSAEVYHPRWSNDVRFFTMTGPYAGESIGKSESKVVEVYIGKFDDEITEVEDWLQVTENEKADFFPDLWVKRPEEAAPAAASVAEVPPKKKAEKRKWPMTGGRLLFLWENRKANNVADSSGRVSKVEAREQARYGPNFDMLCDGGYFEADEETSAAVDGHLGLNRFRYTLEAMVTPFSADQNGTVLSTKAFQIQQRGDDLILVSTEPLPAAYWFGKAEPGVPVHLGVIFNGLEYLIYHNGKPVIQDGHEVAPDMLAAHPGLTFGEGWDGAIEGVSIVPGTIDDWRLERGAQYLLAKLEDRESIPRVRVKGKLLEMTAERSIGDMDYNRALTCYLYEIEEVLEGKLKDEKVLVYHWTIMDRKPLQSFRRPGQSYELLLEPLTDTNHPEIVGEQKWSDLDGYSFNEGLKLYYDVETPKD